ncbi:hypothetical protein [uncultured Tateyamaria sp.]|uniref:hypothetical protein n=1 Tax=uncultured Tateyamaria sp. TaxID=455651 RepID=UPI002606CC44|nr:hypothetical protein [uncultured Tateyamaria sp.]
MMLLVLFTMAFVLGPGLFLILLHYDFGRGPLALVASLLVVASFVLRSEAGLTLALEPVPVFLSIAAIWIAWVLVLVLVVRAWRSAHPTAAAQRWSRAIGAMGTTVPWFGFAAAQMMVK